VRVHRREHLLAVKRLPCCAPGAPVGCEGVIEADHVGRRGVGQKCDDRETIPLCTRHHAERHALAGPFRGFDRERMRAWLSAQLKETQTTVTGVLAGVGGVPF
jgi:hypothetical protein